MNKYRTYTFLVHISHRIRFDSTETMAVRGMTVCVLTLVLSQVCEYIYLSIFTHKLILGMI